MSDTLQKISDIALSNINEQLEAENKRLRECLKDANDTLKALTEILSEHMWDYVGAEGYIGVIEQIEANDEALQEIDNA